MHIRKKTEGDRLKLLQKQTIFSTIKIAGAASISILFAQFLKIEFPVSAGIVTILTIQPTKKETLKTAIGRFLAFLVALVLAYFSFSLFGYTMIGFLLYLFTFIFICQIFQWNNAMAMNSVLISHFLTFKTMQADNVLNEILIFCIGVGIGVIANMHLHKNVNYIETLKIGTDTQIQKILCRMSERILHQDMSDYNGDCFLVLKNHIRTAKNVAEENYNNQFGSSDIYDMEYIRMRDKQCQILYEMYKNIRTIDTTPITAEKISIFLKMMSDVYHQDNTGKELMKQFIELDESLKTQPLPVNRKEFEVRAKLYGLLRNIEEFIAIKIAFSENFIKTKKLFKFYLDK